MVKLCISSRHELRLISLDNVMAIEADGNYCDFIFRDGTRRSELSCLSAFERSITDNYAKTGEACPFCRVGRSLLVNTDFVRSVNLRTGRIAFASEIIQPIAMSQLQLRRLKDFIDRGTSRANNPYKASHKDIHTEKIKLRNNVRLIPRMIQTARHNVQTIRLHIV